MPKKDFGRCDGHHEMDDFHARKKRSAPGLGAAFSFKRKPEHAGAEALIVGCCARATSGHAAATAAHRRTNVGTQMAAPISA